MESTRSSIGGRIAYSPVLVHKIMVREMRGNRRAMVSNLLAECIRQAHERAHERSRHLKTEEGRRDPARRQSDACPIGSS